jgi:hypothetical protein
MRIPRISLMFVLLGKLEIYEIGYVAYHVSGNYDKWRLAKEDRNYLPHWIKQAGYKAECVCNFLSSLYNLLISSSYREISERL